MFDDLAAYYHEHVVTAYRDFRDGLKTSRAGRSRDLRAAIAACEALFHLREHLPDSAGLSRRDAELQCPAYALIADIANVAKHRTVTRPPPHGLPLVTSADQLGELLLITTYEDAQGEYKGTSKEVIAHLDGGEERNVLAAATSVLNFWETHLHRAGILKSARTFESNDRIQYRTREECASSGATFEAIQGVRFRQSLRLMKWNHAAGKAEPVALPPGAKARMTIRERPSYEMDLSITHDQTGRAYSRTVRLTPDESESLDGLAEKLREDFVNSLPTVQGALNEMAQQARDEALAADQDAKFKEVALRFSFGPMPARECLNKSTDSALVR